MTSSTHMDAINGKPTPEAVERVKSDAAALAEVAAESFKARKSYAATLAATIAKAEELDVRDEYGFEMSPHVLAAAIVHDVSWRLDLVARQAAASAGDGDSWEFIDAVQDGARPITAPFLGIVYESSRVLLSGESGCGKSWYALWLVAVELLEGRSVVYVDTDDMGSARFLARLRALGVPDETIAARFLLVRPERAVTEEGVERVVSAIEDDDQGVRLVVVDSFNPALSLEGLDPLKTTDLDTWFVRFAKPINEAGAALLVLDHIPKGSDNQKGGYAYGAERKRSGVTVHVSMKALDPFGFGKVGRARLTVEKDRDGFLGPRGTVVGLFEMHAKPDGSLVTPRMVEDATRGEDGFRPTGIMERVSIFLEGHEGEPVSRKVIEEGVSGRAAYVRQALDVLVAEGNVSEMEGARGARLYVLNEAYFEADDFEPRGRPEVVPARDEVGAIPPSPRRPSSPSLGDEDEDEDRTGSRSSRSSSRGRKKEPEPVESVCVVCEKRQALDGRVTCEECAS